MKAKVITLFLCVFILWSSLLGSAHHSGSSDSLEFNAVSVVLFKAFIPQEKYEAEKLTYFSNIILVNVAINQAYVLQELRTTHSFAHRFGKFYLLFCVLRN
jgi:hypothetical protein